jgi:SPP1 gp7 family putative phage head morphogenesis protein
MARASAWQRARRADTTFSRALVRVARIIGQIVHQFGADHMAARRALEDYGRLLTPWARSTARAMVDEVAARDERVWRERSAAIGSGLRREVARTAVGARAQQLNDEGARLIRSLPLEAAERVTKLSMQAATDGTRASELQKEIMRTGEVTESRARLIARTEVGRAASAITQARAEAVGSTGYIWRTVGDSDVRHSHKKMNGKFVAWDDPPTLDGMTGHAGALPNCRCYSEPVIPD